LPTERRLSAIATPGTAPPTARPTGRNRAQVEGFFVPEMISGVRMCSGRTPIPIRRAGRRRRAGNQFRSFTAAGGFGREVLASTGPMMRF
jgi:hypothetical protein